MCFNHLILHQGIGRKHVGELPRGRQANGHRLQRGWAQSGAGNGGWMSLHPHHRRSGEERLADHPQRTALEEPKS